MFKKIGTIQIDATLQLTDFTWQLALLTFNPITRELQTEVQMWEITARHSRSFAFYLPPNIGAFREQDAINMLLTLPQFVNSQPIV